MEILDAYHALQAAQTGFAVPRASVRHTHITSRPFAIVAYHLAGDAGAPLAMMFGTDPDNPTVIAVPEPRNRQERFDALAQFGGALNDYLATCSLDDEGGPQLLFANPATAQWLLGVVARWTRNLQPDGPFAAPEAVPTAGKNMTAMRDILITPGSSMVFVATDVLTTHFKTGQLAAEDLNLGALLGWVDPAPGLTGQEAARNGERQPPAGPLTDPNWDADYLERFIKRWRVSHDKSTLQAAYRSQHELTLREQMTPAWNDVWRTRELMTRMPATPQAAERYRTDIATWGRHVARMDGIEPARFRNIPYPTMSAHTLALHEENLQTLEATMAQSDPLVRARYASKGQVVDGEVTMVDLAARDNGRVRPLMTVLPALACDIAAGDSIYLNDDPRVTLEVVGSIRATSMDPIQLRVVKGANTRPTMPRIPTLGSQLVASSLRPASYQNRQRLPEVPWTHEMGVAS